LSHPRDLRTHRWAMEHLAWTVRLLATHALLSRNQAPSAVTLSFIPYGQALAAGLASTMIDDEGLGGPKEGGSTVAGAGPEEPGGQQRGAAGVRRPPVDCKTASSEVGT
jgi:hypothetical protein